MVFLISLFLFSLLPSLTFSQNANVSCPLDFNVLSQLIQSATRPAPNSDTTTECNYIRDGLELVLSNYLQRTNSFLPPPTSSESCWVAYQSLINTFLPNFDIRKSCGFKTEWISQGCMNITTKAEFEKLVPKKTLNDVVSSCNQSLENNSPCASCTATLSTLQASYLTGLSVGNVSDCTGYPKIYAAAFANIFGPSDEGTAKCLFALEFSVPSKSGSKKKVVILVVLLVFGVGFCVILGGGWLYLRKRKRRQSYVERVETSLEFGLDSISESTTLVRFTFDDIRKATKNFARDSIIGRGGYGNVYKGVLPDGSEVALKRFKNCSASGDANFTHEVGVIASVRHVNLVALRGYCTATTPFEGHQRIIVCDLMKNGKLGVPEVLEKYVLVAVLCSHPQLYARPTMDQVVKMLETDLSVPSIPARPIPLVAEMNDIERSASSSGSGQLSSPTGYQPYTLENGRLSDHKEEGIKSSE
ncbi:putative lrr receptor-like serine/threonine-protein kinase rkf3 [Quercus suber]|uniref:Lrr receptor-like serine/threonine-protein kinase rkf3 n=1 Tax=Quercus suber TaxID=58331 RepID=A0AAW0K872_QUESU